MMARAAMLLLLLLLSVLPATAIAEEGDRTITKVIKLLQNMMVKSKADGERDTELFAKYKCYCDSNEANKKKAIDRATKSIALLAGKIAELQESNGQMSTDNAQLEFSRGENERARQTADELRSKANADFEEEKADMEAAIEQMNQAIDTLSAIGADQTAAASLVSKHQFLGKKEKIMAANDDALSTSKTTKGETETSKADDEDFLAKLIALCAQKTKEYEDRKMIRANEEAAVAQAISILNSDAAFDTFGATKSATEGETGFVQLRLRTVRKTAREL